MYFKDLPIVLGAISAPEGTIRNIHMLLNDGHIIIQSDGKEWSLSRLAVKKALCRAKNKNAQRVLKNALGLLDMASPRP